MVTEQEQITQAALDYFEGWFDGDADRMERALHPGLNKRHVPVGMTGSQLSGATTADQMIGWTRDGVGRAERPTDLTIEVRVDDFYEQIATATVYSAVYVEYLQLAQTPEGWRIVNTLYMRRNS